VSMENRGSYSLATARPASELKGVAKRDSLGGRARAERGGPGDGEPWTAGLSLSNSFVRKT